MKTPEQIIDDFNMSQSTDQWVEGYVFEDKDLILRKIKEYSKELIEYTLQQAVYKGKAQAEWYRGRFTGDAEIVAESILSLKEQIIKNLNLT